MTSHRQQTGTLFLHPDRNLALELVRATEAAAIRAVAVHRARRQERAPTARRWMRCASSSGPSTSTALIVIGEGEKDEAPMLFNGEHVGNGRGPACDIAVDPIDGTSLTAAGRQNALSVIAVSDRGTMLDASSVFYMDKIVTGPEGVGRRRHPPVDRREHPGAREGEGQGRRRDVVSRCSTARVTSS